MRTICYHEGLYFEWSSIVDAPITYGSKEKEFEEYYLIEYGKSSEDEMKRRMERAKKNGHSSFRNETLKEFVAINRAGPKEECLSFDDIIAIIRTPYE